MIPLEEMTDEDFESTHVRDSETGIGVGRVGPLPATESGDGWRLHAGSSSLALRSGDSGDHV